MYSESTADYTNMKFIVGTKSHMTQIFDDAGNAVAATVVKTGPLVVTQVKTHDSKDKYLAVQVGFGSRKENKINKAEKGHMKGNYAHLREFRTADGETFTIGQTIDLGAFAPGDTVAVSAISKGKGFQGVVKRHGFAGGPRTHGQKHSEREAGSIGGGLRNKVPKKMRMAGRMGGDRITVKNLKVLHIDKDQNLIYVKGAVPGRRGTLVEIIG
jgi:large subunit ribosomal protein L3